MKEEELRKRLYGCHPLSFAERFEFERLLLIDFKKGGLYKGEIPKSLMIDEEDEEKKGEKSEEKKKHTSRHKKRKKVPKIKQNSSFVEKNEAEKAYEELFDKLRITARCSGVGVPNLVKSIFKYETNKDVKIEFRDNSQKQEINLGTLKNNQNSEIMIEKLSAKCVDNLAVSLVVLDGKIEKTINILKDHFHEIITLIRKAREEQNINNQAILDKLAEIEKSRNQELTR